MTQHESEAIVRCPVPMRFINTSCGAQIISRERAADGEYKCENGHEFKPSDFPFTLQTDQVRMTGDALTDWWQEAADEANAKLHNYDLAIDAALRLMEKTRAAKDIDQFWSLWQRSITLLKQGTGR